jgi:hypothetical protein
LPENASAGARIAWTGGMGTEDYSAFKGSGKLGWSYRFKEKNGKFKISSPPADET